MTSTSAKDGMNVAARDIARVAAGLFAKQGYEATSVRMIVEAAGVTKPTLYYHFGSKEGLAQALFTVPMARLVEALRGALDGAGGEAEKLAAMVEAHFAFCREDPDRARFVFALFFGPMSSGLAAELARFADELTGLWDEAARRLAESGTVAADRAAGGITAVRGVLTVYIMDYLYRGGGLGPDLAGCLVGDLLRGFGEANRGDR